jgi:hypothetical protein
LDAGSKEVKVAAIACLGDAPEDLSYLLEQASAKAQDVRQAAYQALAKLDDPAAITVLEKALAGKDLELAADSLQRSRNPKLLRYAIAGAEAELANLRKTKDKKEVGRMIGRIVALAECLVAREDKDAEAFLLKAFAQRDELAKLKSEPLSGPDLNATIVRIMAEGSRKIQAALVQTHATLSGDDLMFCFRAGRRALPADSLFTTFSPYLKAKVDEKKQ